MTAKSSYRFARHMLPSLFALAAMASAASIGACAASASALAAPTSYRPDDLVDTFDVAAPADDSASPTNRPSAGTAPATNRPSPDTASGTSTHVVADAVSRDELARLLEEGEAAYRARRHAEALAAFQRVVSLDPAQTQAWLRLGNLHHLRGKWFEALSAYRRVAARSSGDGVDAAMRAKALYNLALINLELARQSLRQLERIGPAAAAAGEREPLSAAVQSARRRLEGLGEAAPGQRPEARPEARPETRPEARPGGRSEARSEASRRGAAPRGSDAPAELPRIDYFRGAPKP